MSSLVREVTALYAPFGLWRRFYAGCRVALSRFDLVEHQLPPGGRVLDLGCGYGIAANYLALSSPGRSVLGIDWDAKRIAIAEKTVGARPNLGFIRADVLRSEMPRADVVLMNDFLHHLSLKDQEGMLKRVGEALGPGSIVLIHEVNTRPFWKFVCSFLSDMVLYAFEGGHFRPPEEWVALLKGAGFSSVETVLGDQGSIFARVSYIARK